VMSSFAKHGAMPVHDMLISCGSISSSSLDPRGGST